MGMGGSSAARRGPTTPTSTTDPDARLYRRSHHGEAKLSYIGHLLIENRHGLIADARATLADRYAERQAGLWMLHAQDARTPWRRRTVRADKGYDVHDSVGFPRDLGFTPHVAQNPTRRGGSAIDARTTGTTGTPRANTRVRGSSRRSDG